MGRRDNQKEEYVEAIEQKQDQARGVHLSLVEVVHKALQKSSIDFGVTQGVRDLETQKKLMAAGRSQTLKSLHLPQDDGFSHALMSSVILTGRYAGNCRVYDRIADAFKAASEDVGLTLEVGCAWHTHLTNNSKSALELREDYVALRLSQQRKFFLDGPHYQIMNFA